MKMAAVLALVALLSGVLAGCWSRKEITEIAVVLGTGLDLAPDGRIRLSVQIARPSAFSGGGEAGGGRREPATFVVSAEGKTIEEAARYLAMRVPREIYWGHSMILIFGERLARHGLNEALDFFDRERQPRETMWLMVSEGEARDILECHSPLEKSSAQAAAFLTRMRTGAAVQFRQFVEMLAGKGIQPVAPRATLVGAAGAPSPGDEGPAQGGGQVEISGLAVFKEDRLIGWLDDCETRGLLWLKGEVVRGVITVPSPEEPDKEVSFRIRQARTKIIPRYDAGQIRFEARITTEVGMLEQQSSGDLAKPDKIEVLERLVADAIGTRAGATLEKAQKEYGVDIFGFGNAFHRAYKREWRELKDRWDDEFVQAKADITVKAVVRDTGLVTRRPTTPEE